MSAVTGVQVDTGVSAELFVPQVVVVQLLPDDAAEGVHTNTGTLLVLLGEVQVVDVHWLSDVAAEFEQEAAAVGPALFGVQVVVVHAFPLPPAAGVQD